MAVDAVARQIGAQVGPWGGARRLWITRLNAACRSRGLRYGQFINGLQLANVELDRKSLSELAIHDPDTFTKIVDLVKAQLPTAASA